MDEHPGVVFRSGPTGRRAALVDGPDIWELVATLKQVDNQGGNAVRETAELLSLTVHQVHTAVRYYDNYPEEIDERIRRNAEGLSQ